MANKNHKKYAVSYCSGATGYGWTTEYDRLDEFESIIDHLRKEVTAAVDVYDYELGEFIFWKRTLSYKPEIDFLHDLFRDMRTKTRKMK